MKDFHMFYWFFYLHIFPCFLLSRPLVGSLGLLAVIFHSLFSASLSNLYDLMLLRLYLASVPSFSYGLMMVGWLN